MKINEILNCLTDFELKAPRTFKNFEISGLYHDSREVAQGGLFFVLPGTKTHGSKYVKQAVKSGAVCLVTQEILNVKIPQIIVPNARLAMSLIAKSYYKNAVDNLKVVAVVGTNGKTTCTHILRHILNTNGEKCGVIGTLGIFYGERKVENTMTTPDPIELHRIFAEMAAEGIKTVVIEASAHAIHFQKLAGITFEAAIFTNISQDHLDFFHTFENYCNTKINFFLQGECIKTALINIDSEFGQKIYRERTGRSLSYTLTDSGDFAVSNLQLLADKTLYKICEDKKKIDIEINLPARFNAYNAAACIAAARTLGVGWEVIGKALKSIPKIPGRFNTYCAGNSTVIIDYAHTPDGLEKIISAAREISKSRVITVFGCGGNRDKTKRAVMGGISARLSDFTVVTSDNPRDERPLDIMKQIEKGIKKHSGKGRADKNYVMIQDRTEAINNALCLAKAGDIIIIAGKGGETHIEIKGKMIEYTDEAVVADWIGKNLPAKSLPASDKSQPCKKESDTNSIPAQNELQLEQAEDDALKNETLQNDEVKEETVQSDNIKSEAVQSETIHNNNANVHTK